MIVVDWGTSSFRAYRLDAGGALRERRERPRGIAQVPAGGFPQVLGEEIGDWLAGGGETVVLCGMVGSRQGWVDVPYCECPAVHRPLLRRRGTARAGGGSVRSTQSCTYSDAINLVDDMHLRDIEAAARGGERATG
jgi:2-keto-3-deoxy-galactonokinase